jgi:beta-galactosidase
MLLAVASSIGLTAQERQVINLNFGWEFRLNNEGEWRKVNLPHDFQIEQPWVAPAADEKADNTDVAANIKSRLSSRGFKEMGKGWYRLHYTPADSLR